MNVVHLTKSLMLQVGSSPVLYLMIALSVVSVGVILERTWVFARASDDLPALDRDLFMYLEVWDVAGARARLDQSASPTAAILAAGLRAAPRGRTAAADAMNGTATLDGCGSSRGSPFSAHWGATRRSSAFSAP